LVEKLDLLFDALRERGVVRGWIGVRDNVERVEVDDYEG